MTSARLSALALAILLLSADGGAQAVRSTATAPFPNFESGPTRPLLLSPDGTTLFALNTPDHRVEVYRVMPSGRGAAAVGRPAARINYIQSIFTGLEPVSMALHPDDPTTLFVANHVSDSVSVVDTELGHVVATIQVGDEPSDLSVVAGTLVVTCSRAPRTRDDLIDPGDFDENAVVFVDAAAPHAVLGQLTIPAHEPRALVADGDRVWVIPQNSGNHTTSLGPPDADSLGLDQLDLDAFDTPFEVNPILASPELDTPAFVNTKFGLPINGWTIPQTGRIVFDNEYPGLVPQLADEDLFAIDVSTRSLLPTVATGVGTTLFDIDRSPTDGSLWIVGTDANNRTRFEPRLSGAAVDNIVTIVEPAGSVVQTLVLAPPFTSRHHAQPVAIAFYDGAQGSRAYVAALGTSTIVCLDAETLAVVAEFDTAELPVGLAVDDERGLLYVLTLGDRSIQTYDIGANHRFGARRQPLAYDPEPRSISEGRIHLYDARAETGAGNGNMSCATCHVFGHGDSLAWDLGDPGGGIGNMFPDLARGDQTLEGTKLAVKKTFMTHPMKGPMVTQSFRGIGGADGPPLHWRGDRRFFQMFRGAFVGLLGGSGITPLSMQQYAGFVRSITYPPNPFQPRDRQYTGIEADGRDIFGANPAVPGKVYQPLTPGLRCTTCHAVDFAGETDFTGSSPTIVFDGEDQLFNTGQLRGAYEKEFRNLTGFGLFHDGFVDSIRTFLDLELLNFEAFPALTSANRDAVAAFVKAWDTGTAPLVGRQASAPPGTTDALSEFLDLAEAAARPPVGDIDLIAKVHVSRPPFHGPQRGLLYADDGTGTWSWTFDTGHVVDRDVLLDLIDLGWMEATFTAVPPGTGRRLGIDRDEDSLLDGTERSLGTKGWSPDSDQDGYADGLEVALGANPALADLFLAADVQPPVPTTWSLHDVFADTATLQVVLDEAGSVRVEVGTLAGTYSLASFESPAFMRRHDVHLTGLPPMTELFYRVVTGDKNGNSTAVEGSFATAAALYHVDAMELTAEGTGPYTLTGRVLIVDQSDDPVPDIPVKVLWAGDLGGGNFFPPPARTTPDGWATFVLGPFTPAGPTTVSLSPAWLGVNVADTYFIGEGGDDPTWFYNQSANRVSFRSVDLP